MRKIEIKVYSVKDDGYPEEKVKVCRNLELEAGILDEWMFTNNIHNILKDIDCGGFCDIYFGKNYENVMLYRNSEDAIKNIKPIACWYKKEFDPDAYRAMYSMDIEPVEDCDEYIIIDELKGAQNE